ncbi:MAG: hypothetical protein LUE10_05760 [Alistipes sp.]|nr:hypothetical protein [Alistipes sp.]
MKITAAGLIRCGSVTITAADGITSIHLPKLAHTGAIQLSSPNLLAADFPALESCASIYLSAANLSYLNLPSLRTVTENITLAGLPLKGFNAFSALETVGGFFTIQAMASVGDMSGFRSLRSVEGTLTVRNVAITELASLPALENVGQLVLSDLRKLESLDRIGKLEHIPSLELELLSGETVLDLSGLPVGNLALNEVEDVLLTAPECISGTLTLQSCENITVRGLKSTGAVTFSATGVAILPDLQWVEGDLRLPVTTTSRETSARFPNLVLVGGDLTIMGQNRT